MEACGIDARALPDALGGSAAQAPAALELTSIKAGRAQAA